MRFLLACSTLLWLACGVRAGALEDLVSRVAPALSGRVSFQIDPARQEIALLPGEEGHFTIVAPETRLAAAGLGCYLRAVAGAHWSWCGNRLDVAMPAPETLLTFAPAYPDAFAYNYCTLSYTMAFWDEQAWREEIDRLALYGFKHVLVQAGLPKVWQGVLRELGVPEEQIAAFLPDSAAAAWWNMGNLEGLGGPLSQAEIERDADVGRFIVRELRALGMEPVLQGFTGLVPSTLPESLPEGRLPGARFVPQGKWAGGFQRPTLLRPDCEAFPSLAARWYRHLFAVYGIDRADAFAGDLFHEGGKAEGVDPAVCARAVQAAQQAASPGALWFVQAWGANPTAALLKGLDPRVTRIEALVKNQQNGHHAARAFGDIPWLWCELVNFGGNHGLYGGMRAFADLGDLARQPNAKTLVGLGLLSEGLETNPLCYELFTQRLFMPKTQSLGAEGLDAWLADYARRRYGQCPDGVLNALRLLLASAYSPVREQEGCTESLYCARPGWSVTKASAWACGKPYYPPVSTLLAAQALLRAAEAHPALLEQETFRYDLVDAARQALADLAPSLLRDARKGRLGQAAFLEAIRLTDALLACHPRWRLDTYEARVRRFGGERAVRAWRRMVTTWSGKRDELDDYAHRQLAGLMGGYCLKRWEIFFNQPGGADAPLSALDRAFAERGADAPPPGDLLEALRAALDFAQARSRI